MIKGCKIEFDNPSVGKMIVHVSRDIAHQICALFHEQGWSEPFCVPEDYLPTLLENLQK